MADRKKVLNGLKCCSKSIGKACPLECPYRVECLMQDDGSHMYSVMHDALKLLKEQQETISSLQGTICKLNAALAEQPEQKFFVDSDGKITPIPVQKHGHWIRSPRFLPEAQCSVCKGTCIGDCRAFDYCPSCGAIMDEEVKQE